MKMRPVFENGAPVPAFLNKLWKMVDDEKTNNLISWGPNGKSFIIKHQGEFCAELLPQFYKHSNMASFVRQLNMYGFHKVSNIESGGIRSDREEIEFVHPCFKRDEPKLVEHIKRKMSSRMSQSNHNQQDDKSLEIMSKVLDDVEQMRGKQLSLDAQLAQMKQHNVALWRELSLLRRKHMKQQQIVNKLIQFLVSFVQPSRSNLNGVGIKRRFPLMINDTQGNAKVARTDSSGPTIHELDPTETLLEEADFLEPVIEIYSPEMATPTNAGQNIESMKSSPSSFEYDENDECPLSPDLMFATSPHLVTPSTVTVTEPEQTSVTVGKSKKGSKRAGGRKSRKQGNNQMQFIDISEPLVSSPAPPVEVSIDPILVSPTNGTDIFEAAADLLSMDSESQDPLGDLVSVENPTLSSTTDLTTLLNHISPENEKDDATPPVSTVTTNNKKTLLSPGSYGVNTSRIFARKEDNGSANSTSGVPSPASTSKMTVATVTPDNNIPLLNTAEDFDGHLESVQNDLDSLKDLLSNEGYSLDANTLLGLFGSEDPMSYTIPMTNNENAIVDTSRNDPSADNDFVGSELIAYPSPFDFDMFTSPEPVGTPDNSMDAIDSASLMTPKVENKFNSY